VQRVGSPGVTTIVVGGAGVPGGNVIGGGVVSGCVAGGCVAGGSVAGGCVAGGCVGGDVTGAGVVGGCVGGAVADVGKGVAGGAVGAFVGATEVVGVSAVVVGRVVAPDVGVMRGTVSSPWLESRELPQEATVESTNTTADAAQMRRIRSRRLTCPPIASSIGRERRAKVAPVAEHLSRATPP
jgi:hypothetical protein